MGITAFAAATLIEKGFLAGGNASGELLDILKEYGPQLSAVGIEAEQAIAIITQQVKQGVFSDKPMGPFKPWGPLIPLNPLNERVANRINLFFHESIKHDKGIIFIGEDVLDPYGGAF